MGATAHVAQIVQGQHGGVQGQHFESKIVKAK